MNRTCSTPRTDCARSLASPVVSGPERGSGSSSAASGVLDQPPGGPALGNPARVGGRQVHLVGVAAWPWLAGNRTDAVAEEQLVVVAQALEIDGVGGPQVRFLLDLAQVCLFGGLAGFDEPRDERPGTLRPGAPASVEDTPVRRRRQHQHSRCEAVLPDCPPNLNLATQNALVASDAYVIVAMPEYLSSVGLATIQKAVAGLEARVNRPPQTFGGTKSFVAPPLKGIILNRVRYVMGGAP